MVAISTVQTIYNKSDISRNLVCSVSMFETLTTSPESIHFETSFQYKGAKIWNDLPNKMKNSITLGGSKNQIKKWQGPKCLCNMCTRLL